MGIETYKLSNGKETRKRSYDDAVYLDRSVGFAGEPGWYDANGEMREPDENLSFWKRNVTDYTLSNGKKTKKRLDGGVYLTPEMGLKGSAGWYNANGDLLPDEDPTPEPGKMTADTRDLNPQQRQLESDRQTSQYVAGLGAQARKEDIEANETGTFDRTMRQFGVGGTSLPSLPIEMLGNAARVTGRAVGDLQASMGFTPSFGRSIESGGEFINNLTGNRELVQPEGVLGHTARLAGSLASFSGPGGEAIGLKTIAGSSGLSSANRALDSGAGLGDALIEGGGTGATTGAVLKALHLAPVPAWVQSSPYARGIPYGFARGAVAAGVQTPVENYLSRLHGGNEERPGEGEFQRLYRGYLHNATNLGAFEAAGMPSRIEASRAAFVPPDATRLDRSWQRGTGNVLEGEIVDPEAQAGRPALQGGGPIIDGEYTQQQRPSLDMRPQIGDRVYQGDIVQPAPGEALPSIRGGGPIVDADFSQQQRPAVGMRPQLGFAPPEAARPESVIRQELAVAQADLATDPNARNPVKTAKVERLQAELSGSRQPSLGFTPAEPVAEAAPAPSAPRETALPVRTVEPMPVATPEPVAQVEPAGLSVVYRGEKPSVKMTREPGMGATYAVDLSDGSKVRIYRDTSRFSSGLWSILPEDMPAGSNGVHAAGDLGWTRDEAIKKLPEKLESLRSKSNTTTTTPTEAPSEAVTSHGPETPTLKENSNVQEDHVQAGLESSQVRPGSGPQPGQEPDRPVLGPEGRLQKVESVKQGSQIIVKPQPGTGITIDSARSVDATLERADHYAEDGGAMASDLMEAAKAKTPAEAEKALEILRKELKDPKEGPDKREDTRTLLSLLVADGHLTMIQARRMWTNLDLGPNRKGKDGKTDIDNRIEAIRTHDKNRTVAEEIAQKDRADAERLREEARVKAEAEAKNEEIQAAIGHDKIDLAKSVVDSIKEGRQRSRRESLVEADQTGKDEFAHETVEPTDTDLMEASALDPSAEADAAKSFSDVQKAEAASAEDLLAKILSGKVASDVTPEVRAERESFFRQKFPNTASAMDAITEAIAEQGQRVKRGRFIKYDPTKANMGMDPLAFFGLKGEHISNLVKGMLADGVRGVDALKKTLRNALGSTYDKITEAYGTDKWVESLAQDNLAEPPNREVFKQLKMDGVLTAEQARARDARIDEINSNIKKANDAIGSDPAKAEEHQAKIAEAYKRHSAHDGAMELDALILSAAESLGFKPSEYPTVWSSIEFQKFIAEHADTMGSYKLDGPSPVNAAQRAWLENIKRVSAEVQSGQRAKENAVHRFILGVQGSGKSLEVRKMIARDDYAGSVERISSDVPGAIKDSARVAEAFGVTPGVDVLLAPWADVVTGAINRGVFNGRVVLPMEQYPAYMGAINGLDWVSKNAQSLPDMKIRVIEKMADGDVTHELQLHNPSDMAKLGQVVSEWRKAPYGDGNIDTAVDHALSSYADFLGDLHEKGAVTSGAYNMDAVRDYADAIIDGMPGRIEDADSILTKGDVRARATEIYQSLRALDAVAGEAPSVREALGAVEPVGARDRAGQGNDLGSVPRSELHGDLDAEGLDAGGGAPRDPAVGEALPKPQDGDLGVDPKSKRMDNPERGAINVGDISDAARDLIQKSKEIIDSVGRRIGGTKLASPEELINRVKDINNSTKKWLADRTINVKDQLHDAIAITWANSAGASVDAEGRPIVPKGLMADTIDIAKDMSKAALNYMKGGSPSMVTDRGLFGEVFKNGSPVVDWALQNIRRNGITANYHRYFESLIKGVGNNSSEIKDRMRPIMDRFAKKLTELKQMEDRVNELLPSDLKKEIDATNAKARRLSRERRELLDAGKPVPQELIDKIKANNDVAKDLSQKKAAIVPAELSEQVKKHRGAIDGTRFDATEAIKNMVNDPKFSDVRIFMAADYGADKMPKWLADKMSKGELAIATELTKVTKNMGAELQARGIPVIEGSYMHRPFKVGLSDSVKALLERSGWKNSDVSYTDRKDIDFHERESNSSVWLPSLYDSLESYSSAFAEKLTEREFLNKWQAWADQNAGNKSLENTVSAVRDLAEMYVNPERMSPAVRAAMEWTYTQRIGFSLAVGFKHAGKFLHGIYAVGPWNYAKGIARYSESAVGNIIKGAESRSEALASVIKAAEAAGGRGFIQEARLMAEARKAWVGAKEINRYMEMGMKAPIESLQGKSLYESAKWLGRNTMSSAVDMVENVERGILFFGALEQARGMNKTTAESLHHAMVETLRASFLPHDRGTMTNSQAYKAVTMFGETPKHLLETPLDAGSKLVRTALLPVGEAIVKMAKGDAKGAGDALKGADYNHALRLAVALAIYGAITKLDEEFDTHVAGNIVHVPPVVQTITNWASRITGGDDIFTGPGANKFGVGPIDYANEVMENTKKLGPAAAAHDAIVPAGLRRMGENPEHISPLYGDTPDEKYARRQLSQPRASRVAELEARRRKMEDSKNKKAAKTHEEKYIY